MNRVRDLRDQAAVPPAVTVLEHHQPHIRLDRQRRTPMTGRRHPRHERLALPVLHKRRQQRGSHNSSSSAARSCGSSRTSIGSASSHNVSACAATNRNIPLSLRQKHAHMQAYSDDRAGRTNRRNGPDLARSGRRLYPREVVSLNLASHPARAPAPSTPTATPTAAPCERDDRQPHSPACRQATRCSARRRGRRRGRAADAHRRHERRVVPRGATSSRALPAGLRGDRPPPQRGDRLRRRRPRRAARARRAPALRRDRRDGPGLLPRPRAHADQQRAFVATSTWPAKTGKPLVIHTRAAEDDTIDTLREHAGGIDVILHCFSMADRLDECAEQGWWMSFAGNVTYPKAQDIADAAQRVPADACSSRPTRPISPAARAQAAKPARLRAHTARFVAERRGDRLRRARGARRAQRRDAVRMVSRAAATHGAREAGARGTTTQPSLRRMRDFGIRPKRDLGQNFLIDSNILGVIEREAQLGARRRRARDRRRARRAVRVPCAARRACARRGARPRARAGAARCRSTRSTTSRCTSPTR